MRCALRTAVGAPRTLLTRRLGGNKAAQQPDAGTAIIEFCFLAVLLLIPLAYVVLTVFRLQSAAYGVSSAAREAGRIFVTSDPDTAGARALSAAEVAMTDHGQVLARESVRITCSEPGDCLRPEGTVRVAVQHRVALPLVPDFFDAVVPTSVTVSAEHLEYVDRVRAVQ